MACDRETSADAGSTSSATPVCQTPGNARIPCCNSDCRFFGCAATMNFCSKCYSEHILKEGTGAFPHIPCEDDDGSVQKHGADEADDSEYHADTFNQGMNSVPADLDSRVDAAMADASSVPNLRSKGRSSLRTTLMKPSPSVSDLTAVFGSAPQASSSSSWVGTSADLSQLILPPLSLSPPCLRTASPPAAQQIESKLSLLSVAVPARQQATNRCFTCRKRVGLVGFKCRCGDLFCASHRYSDKHDCSFDYKAAGRAAIARENPVVKANKVERI